MIDKHAPIRKFRASANTKIPWYSDEIDSMKKIRDYYHKRAIAANLTEDWTKYRHHRNKVTGLVRKAKQEYYTAMIDKNSGDSKSMWKILKDLLPRCSTGGITSLEVNGSLVTSFSEIANIFNNFFTDVGTNLAAQIPSTVRSPMDYVKSYMKEPATQFSFKPVSAKDVKKLIMNIPNGKATGLDNIQARLLKMSSPAISSSLAYIFNLSLTTGKFPKDWKMARLSPIYKKGSKLEPGNYRPVSVLPVVSKFIERIAHNQLYNYLTENNLLCKQQSGFRQKHSCQTSLHRLTEYFYDKLHEGKVIGMIALDLRKAFDTVNHDILLQKLSFYGIKGKNNQWFRSYLSDRIQVCSVFNNQSEPSRVTCGVPQGSILGPLLFILYVNDMPACFTKSEVNIYADDTAFYYCDFNVCNVKAVLQAEFISVSGWLCANKLSLHIGKTNSMLICNRQKLAHLDTTEIDISKDGESIEQVNQVKYLGLNVDSHLKFDMYMDQLIGKLNRSLGVLRRASRYVNQKTRITLYNTLILPHIDYCSTVWGGSIKKGDLMRLQRVQNSAMRIILECHPRTHIVDRLSALKWLNIEQRLHYNLCILMWKIVHEEVPMYLSNLFGHIKQIHSYNTRSSKNSKLFKVHSHPKSLHFQGTSAWNDLPQQARFAQSISCFKREVSEHVKAMYPL